MEQAANSKNMFWGVTLHPKKRYEQTPEDPFHISKACLEPSSVKKTEGVKPHVSVYYETGSDEFLLCTLTSNNLNESLDLNFNQGEKICFRVEGGGVVHLTGYLMVGDAEFSSDFEEDSSDEEEEDEIEEANAKKVNGHAKKLSPLDKLLQEKKPEKSNKKADDIMAEIKKAEDRKKKLEAGKKKQQPQKDESDDDDESSDDEDDDDEDDEMVDLEAEEAGEEEEEEDDDDEDGEEEEDSEDDSDEEQESTPPKKEVKKVEKEATKPENKNKTPSNTPAKPAESKTPGAENKTPKAKEGVDAKTPKGPKDGAAATPGKTPRRTLKNGLIIEDTQVGKGAEAKAGKMVGAYYVGKLKGSNKVFDSCQKGKPFKFRLGRGEVIKAWDIGFEGMKVGGKRTIISPPGLAYGSKGAPPEIPPNSTLVFDVECKYVD